MMAPSRPPTAVPADASAVHAGELPGAAFPKCLPQVQRDGLAGFLQAKRVTCGLPDIRGKFQRHVRPQVPGGQASSPAAVAIRKSFISLRYAYFVPEPALGG